MSRDPSMKLAFGLAYGPGEEEKMEKKLIELPTVEEIEDWCNERFARLNPDYRDYLLMGVEALYTHLGGEKFITVRMPGGKE